MKTITLQAAQLVAVEVVGWMDAQTAAKYAGMSPRVLARLARNKKIRGKGVGFDGAGWKFKPEAIDSYLIANAGGR